MNQLLRQLVVVVNGLAFKFELGLIQAMMVRRRLLWVEGDSRGTQVKTLVGLDKRGAQVACVYGTSQ